MNIKFIFLMSLVAITFVSKAQFVTIADTNMVNWFVNNGYASCISSNQLDTTCAATIYKPSIIFSDSSISDFNGIQYLTQTTELNFTNCKLNNLATLPNSVVDLLIIYSDIDSLNYMPNNVKNLYIQNTNIKKINALSDSLEILSLYQDYQLNTIAALPTSIKAVLVYDMNPNITSVLPSSYLGFPMLQTIQLRNCALTSVPTLPNTVVIADFSFNNIANWPLLPNSVADLSLEHNNLSSISSLPSSLYKLNVSSNQLTTFPSFPSNLQYLSFDDNNFSVCPTFSYPLYELSCKGNMLSSLSALPSSLNFLYCDSNGLTSLPTLPNFLQRLTCSNNLLTSLPPMPNHLSFIDASYNSITTLPPLSPIVNYLYFSHNLIDSVWTQKNIDTSSFAYDVSVHYDFSYNNVVFCDTIYSSLTGFTSLILNHNQLTSIPPFKTFGDPSNNLNYIIYGFNHNIDLTYNNITNIPSLDSNFTNIKIGRNGFTSLPDLPQKLAILDLDSAYNLLCVPLLPTTLKWFYLDNTGVTCLPNKNFYANNHGASWSLLPICNLQNANGCPVARNIYGYIHKDNNSNCIYDGADSSIANIKVDMYKNNTYLQSCFTDNFGMYHLQTGASDSFTVSIDTLSIYYNTTCPSSGNKAVYIGPLDTAIKNVNIGIECKPGIDLGVGAVLVDSGCFRNATFARVKIFAGDMSKLYNLDCNANVSGNLKVILNGPIQYITTPAGYIAPSNVNGDTLTYTIANFAALSFVNDFAIMIQTDTNAPLNAPVCIDAACTFAGLDLDNSNNTTNICGTVVNSYDPNIKQVSPIYEFYDKTNWLTYTIHFQNTGNDTAFNINIIDTLDNKLDLSTFTFLGSSHNCNARVMNNPNQAIFEFRNINLLDSFHNEPLSHGLLQYKIKPKSSIVINDNIKNSAAIYFDYNQPIITNTTTNKFSDPLFIKPLALGRIMVWPNPFANTLNMRFDEPNYTLEVYNIAGIKVFSAKVNSTDYVIHTASWPAGIYACRCINPKGQESTLKIIK
ncbi:MAG: hypothetical protein RL660_2738 [Bacteroidota bacterium]|jgi:uncharacterized repeat protein (TIGR01451 family)